MPRPADSVVLLLIDGLRPDALQQADTPHIDRLMSTGSYTLQARSVVPALTLPCMTSICFSAEPAEHGVPTNRTARHDPSAPGIFDWLYAQGLATAMFHNWAPLKRLGHHTSFCQRTYVPNGKKPETDGRLARLAAAHLQQEDVAFALVYLGVTDEMAHAHGFLSRPYMDAIERADEAVGVVLEGIGRSVHADRTAVFVAADHGGHDKTHDGSVEEDLRVPLIVSGSGIPTGPIEQEVSIIDIAPTVTNVLGLEPPPDWRGRAVGFNG
ncbi:MAG: alkaline phosphatase family protein, partial [Phycisphaerae bacterium]